jgi:hypothetical protein
MDAAVNPEVEVVDVFPLGLVSPTAAITMSPAFCVGDGSGVSVELGAVTGVGLDVVGGSAVRVELGAVFGVGLDVDAEAGS